MSLMPLRSISLLCALTFTACSALAFQSTGNEALQSLQSVVASNQARLQNYQWTETATVLVADKADSQQKSLCRYGRGGKVRRTLAIDPGDFSQQHQHGGLRSRAVQTKTADTKDDVAHLETLTSDYLPLNPEKMQAANASLAPGTSDLYITNYLKPGDKLTFTLDSTARKIRTITIQTYLDDPASNPITLTATFASLPDGTSYIADTDLKSSDKKLEIKTVSSNYEKLFR
jgi:hypothetical protein